MCIRSEVEEILFKLATNDHSDEAGLLADIEHLTFMGCLSFGSSSHLVNCIMYQL